MADNGTPASLIDAFFRFFSAGEFDDSAVTTTVHEITGRSPRTFDHWAHAHANLFGEPPAAAYWCSWMTGTRRRDDHQSVRLDYSYPDARLDLNRWLPLVKWLLAIPHYIALAFLEIAAVVVVIVAWFAILFTGRYLRPLAERGRGPATIGDHGRPATSSRPAMAGSTRWGNLRPPGIQRAGRGST